MAMRLALTRHDAPEPSTPPVVDWETARAAAGDGEIDADEALDVAATALRAAGE